MRAMRENVPLQLAAWGFFLALVCAAAFFGQQFLFAWSYTWSGAWDTTAAFYQMLWDRETQVLHYLQYQTNLEQEDLSYVDQEQYTAWLEGTALSLSSDHTNFRFELLSEDGSGVVDSNLGTETERLEEQVSNLYYGVIQIQDGTVTFVERREGDSSDWGQSSQSSSPVLENTDSYPPETLVLRYGVLQPERMNAQDEFSALCALYDRYAGNGMLYGGLFLAFCVLALLILLFQLWAAGHQAGQEGIVLAGPDRVFSEVWLLVLAGGTWLLYLALGEYEIAFYQTVEQADQNMANVLLAAGTVMAGMWVLLAAAVLRTAAVRLKGRALARTTLLCRVVQFLWKRITEFLRDLPLTWRVLVFFLIYLTGIFIVDHVWIFPMFYPLLGVLINLAALMGLCWWSAGFWRVRKGTEVIAAGNLNHQIETAHLPDDLKHLAEALNNISGGLTQAVNEQMKSERFKAELITNVSHDLKTPLTSIINYVSLLKSTEQTDPKAQEYIEVLDRKSQRLKKLTEDLVEASKASTGALPVNREKIGMVQLLDQALGEYEDRLESKKLSVVCTVPEGECFVFADGRHLWRVIDNLLSNCAKYALEGTRVYLELFRGKGSVSLSVKNISREPLNVPPERLMERFVRGDTSRTTEGSGLGLSIAKSLTELQGGSFELMVDGDLFKVMVTLPQAS